MLGSIEKKAIVILENNEFNCYPTVLTESYDSMLVELNQLEIPKRIHDGDFTVWSDSPVEISNRLGWLKSPINTLNSLDEINDFVLEIKKEGFSNGLLLEWVGHHSLPRFLVRHLVKLMDFFLWRYLTALILLQYLKKRPKLAEEKDTIYCFHQIRWDSRNPFFS